MEIKVDSRVLWTRNSEGNQSRKVEEAGISLKRSRRLIYVGKCVP
jgi:hypothetical protein